jgi:hypothetical protein
MSIIWIDSTILTNTKNLEFSDTRLLIYLNTISILSCMIFAYFYKINTQLQKFPSKINLNTANLIFLKMLTEMTLSILLLIIFIGVYLKTALFTFLVEIVLAFIPTVVFLLYFFNACVSHNLYLTYYDYKKGYEKRFLAYKYLAVISGFLIYIFTLFSIDMSNYYYPFGNDRQADAFSFTLYNKKFVALFYIGCLILTGYILRNIYYIKIVSHELEPFSFEESATPGNNIQQMLIESMIKRHIISLTFFSAIFLPNNIYMILRVASIEPDSYFVDTLLSLFLCGISFSSTFTFVLKFTDPYIQKYFRKKIRICPKKRRGIGNLSDLKTIVGDNLLNTITEPRKLEDSIHYCNIYTTDTNINPASYNDTKTELKEMSEIKPTPKAYETADSESYRFFDSRVTIPRKLSISDSISCYSSESERPSLMNSLPQQQTVRKTSMILKQGSLTFDIMNSRLEFSDNLYRMVGISIALNEDKQYEHDNFYKNKFKTKLPWENKYYKEKSKFQEFTQNNLPDWVNIKYDKRFKSIKLKIKKYVPLIFHHIRTIDGVTIDDCIKSLDPLLNLKNKDMNKLSGGNSGDPILNTWDGKILVKTISKEEKRLLIQMIKEYQIRMRDTKTLLTRVYGLFRMQVASQFDSYVLLMKNMCELPSDTVFLKFDLKGSTVNRSCLKEVDKDSYKKGLKTEILGKYKNAVLKDSDLDFLGVKFLLSYIDGTNLITSVENDSDFLANYGITDYSLLVAIHTFSSKESFKPYYTNTRIYKSSDEKFIFNFAIIDFLTVICFNFSRMILIREGRRRLKKLPCFGRKLRIIIFR